MEKEQKLKNMNVALFESRLSETLADMIKLHGGVPVRAPALKEVPLENNREAFLFADKLFKDEIHVVIFLTGVGTRFLMSVLETRYPREKIVEALKKIPVIPRGPKPIRVLSELGVPYAMMVPEPNTWKEILAVLDQNNESVPLRGRTVALQEYGVPNPELIEGLEQRGAFVLKVPVYRWALPDDLEPLKKAITGILEGKIQVVMVTTSVQVDHLFRVARSTGSEEKLKDALKKVVIASVGPDSSRTIRSYGLTVDIEPASPKMGPLVLETAEKARAILERKVKNNQ